MTTGSQPSVRQATSEQRRCEQQKMKTMFPSFKVRKQFHCWGFPFTSFHQRTSSSSLLSLLFSHELHENNKRCPRAHCLTQKCSSLIAHESQNTSSSHQTCFRDSSGQTLQLAQSHVRNCFLVLTIGHPS